jgi:hypothetical protein
MQNSNALAWQIAKGIMIAFLTLWTLRAIAIAIVMHEAQIATNEITRQLQAASRTQRIAQQRNATPRLTATTLPMVEATPSMPTNERCVGKQLFRVLPNGFEQVTDGSAAKLCH